CGDGLPARPARRRLTLRPVSGGTVMSICVDRDPSAVPATFRESDPASLTIGLVNNMPDAALQSTERQFAALLGAAAGDLAVRVRLFALPEVPRTEWGHQYVSRFYAGLDDLWGSRLDGLIVTGTEPRSADLKAEPYWGSLTRVLDWAAGHTQSTVWSCLGAHAAVLHLDGIGRRGLADVRVGVFEWARVSERPRAAG